MGGSRKTLETWVTVPECSSLKPSQPEKEPTSLARDLVPLFWKKGVAVTGMAGVESSSKLRWEVVERRMLRCLWCLR